LALALAGTAKAGLNPGGVRFVLSNVALGGAAFQSSTDYGGVASRANDGDTNGNYGGNSVTHTASFDATPFWQVDLLNTYNIEEIDVWNRTDCCSGRLTNFRVSILDSSSLEVYGQDFYTGGGFPNPTLQIFTSASGQFVKVMKYNNPDPGFNDDRDLSLAEVQVFGSQIVPEPSTLALIAVGLGSLVTYLRRRK
jgi:F5/8 type C domain-containing protein/PEP-CTERM motif-containing protein